MDLYIIKQYLKSLNIKNFYPEKVIMTKIDGHNKLYHNNDFITYISPDQTINDIEPNIKKYINNLKSKITTCIICITCTDTRLIDIILNQYINTKYNLIIICPNNNYLKFAIANNINYIISPKNDYMIMISTCLLNIKMSNIFNDIVLITNTETLIHHSLIGPIINSHKHDTHISIPQTLKHINLLTSQIKNIIIPKNTILSNWFITNKNFNISSINNKNINIQQIQMSGTLCTNSSTNKYSETPINLSPEELQTLSVLSEYSIKFNNVINKMNNNHQSNTQQIITINQTYPNHDNTTQNTKFKTYMTKMNITINKFYFINISQYHQYVINNTFKKNMQQITNSNIDAITDAKMNDMNYVCIVDGYVLSDELFKVLLRGDIDFLDMGLIIFIPDNKYEIIKYNNHPLTKFAYCIHKDMYDIMLNYLLEDNDIIKAIKNIYVSNKLITIIKYPINHINNIKPTKNNILIPSYIKKTKDLIKSKFVYQSMPIYPSISIMHSDKRILDRVYHMKQETRAIEPVRTYTIIQSVFNGSYLSKNEVNAILSFIGHNHIYHLYAYKKIFNVPVGCIVKNANIIIPNGYTKINAFKYKLLHSVGMYWVNLDTVCTKKFDDVDPYLFLENNDTIIKCPPGSQYALDCYNAVIQGTYDMNVIITKHKLNKYIKKTLNEPVIMRQPINHYKNNKQDIKDNMFNLENIYGKYNNVGVIIYWMPANTSFIDEMETLLNSNAMANIRTSNYHVKKNIGNADNKRIKNFIENDIYIYIMTRMLELGLIDNIHIIFGTTSTGKYLYNNQPLFNDGNYYNYNKNIHMWKLTDIKSVLSFTHAKMYFYKGYGIYEHLYSWMAFLSPHSVFIRYLATSFPLIQKGKDIVIDNDWVNGDYANNRKCKLINKNVEYFKKHYTNYDILFMDTKEKEEYYKILFPNVKKFVKLYKYSLMNIDNFGDRYYDVMFCASDAHPSKNWDIFNSFLAYCDMKGRKLKILIATPVVSNKTFDEYNNFKHVKVVVKKNLVYEEMIEAYNSCRCLLITFGRDATPRAMSEALKCGCFNIVLDILSDGQDMIINNPNLGKIIHVPLEQVEYETSYKSIKCKLTNIQYDEMYDMINKEYDHKFISDEFMKDYDERIVTKNMCDMIKGIIINKNKMVVTLATENYANNLNYLLSSIRYTNPGVMVMVYCVRWRNVLLNQFKIAYPKYHFEDYSFRENYVKGDIIRLKVKIQKHVYTKFTNGYIWIDADSIVLGNLNKLFDLIPKYTLSCYHRPEENYYMSFAVGVIIFGKMNDNNDGQKLNLEFVNKYYENSVITEGFNGWFYDQTSLHDVYELYKDKIKMYPLSESEHSINDTLDTIIYSRRVDNKYKLIEILRSRGIVVTNINFGNVAMVYA